VEFLTTRGAEAHAPIKTEKKMAINNAGFRSLKKISFPNVLSSPK